MSAPSISLYNTSTMVEFENIDASGGTMHYLLYADNSQFDSWTDWVNDPAS